MIRLDIVYEQRRCIELNTTKYRQLVKVHDLNDITIHYRIWVYRGNNAVKLSGETSSHRTTKGYLPVKEAGKAISIAAATMALRNYTRFSASYSK